MTALPCTQSNVPFCLACVHNCAAHISVPRRRDIRRARSWALSAGSRCWRRTGPHPSYATTNWYRCLCCPCSSQKRDRPIYASHIKSVEKHKRRKQVVVVRGPYIVYQLSKFYLPANGLPSCFVLEAGLVCNSIWSIAMRVAHGLPLLTGCHAQCCDSVPTAAETEILADLHALSGKASRREHREMIMS